MYIYYVPDGDSFIIAGHVGSRGSLEDNRTVCNSIELPEGYSKYISRLDEHITKCSWEQNGTVLSFHHISFLE